MAQKAPPKKVVAQLRRIGALASLLVPLWIAPAGAKLPPQGLYESCSPRLPDGRGDCTARLAHIAKGGFRLVLNYSALDGDAAQVLAYADAAQRVQLKLIWPLGSVYWSQPDLVRQWVRTVDAHPATWGYYIGEETRPEYLDQVAAVGATIRSESSRPLLYVSRPNLRLLAPFIPLADYVGPDIYPVGGFQDPSVGPMAARSAGMVRKRDRNPIVVLQAFSWSVDFPQFPDVFPTRRRMLQMRNSAIRCGKPKMILWFAYHAIYGEHPHPYDYWRAVRKAAFADLPRSSRCD